jgi:hypothetical protein
MAELDQSRPFAQRLNDFGPELGAFLGRVWQGRALISLTDFDLGTNAIYGLYSGNTANRAYNSAELGRFIKSLRNLARNFTVHVQSFDRPLSDFSDAMVRVNGRDLWDDFFHVLASPSPSRQIRNRVYVHAANAPASLQLMTAIVGQFGNNNGLWEVKTAGPGATRLDTIVAYHYDANSRDALVQMLIQLSQSHAGLFVDMLPPLVKRAGPGIGTADEPPAIEIFRNGGTRHSFGSFFSTLCWVALKNTPKVNTPAADGRHMLDNMLYSLRLLRVDPKNPQEFPEAGALEAWYQAQVP